MIEHIRIAGNKNETVVLMRLEHTHARGQTRLMMQGRNENEIPRAPD